MAIQMSLSAGDLLENGPWAGDLWGTAGNEYDDLLARALEADGQKKFAKWLLEAARAGDSQTWEVLAQLYRQGFADAFRATEALAQSMMEASEG